MYSLAIVDPLPTTDKRLLTSSVEPWRLRADTCWSLQSPCSFCSLLLGSALCFHAVVVVVELLLAAQEMPGQN